MASLDEAPNAPLLSRDAVDQPPKRQPLVHVGADSAASPTQGKCQEAASNFLQSKTFGICIVGVICLSTLTMLADRQGMAPTNHHYLEIASHVPTRRLEPQTAHRHS